MQRLRCTYLFSRRWKKASAGMKIVNRAFDSGDLNKAVPKRCHLLLLLRRGACADVILTCIDGLVAKCIASYGPWTTIARDVWLKFYCHSHSISSHFSTAHCGRLIKLTAGPIADICVCRQTIIARWNHDLDFYLRIRCLCVGNAVIWLTLIMFDFCNQNNAIVRFNFMQQSFTSYCIDCTRI